MRRTIFSLLAYFFVNFLIGQHIDSLMAIATSKPDTNAALAYYEVGKLIYGQTKDSSIQFFKKGEELSDQLNYPKGMILNLRSLGSALGRLGRHEEAMSYLEKGMQLIERENLPIINKVDFLINAGAAHYFAGYTGRAIESYIDAVQICRENNFDEKRSMLLNNLGIFYRSLDRHDETIKIYDEAYELRRKLGDENGMGNIAHNRAAAYGKMGEYEKALESIQEAKAIFESLNKADDVKLCALATGTFLIDLKRFEDASRYLIPLSKDDNLSFETSHKNNLYEGLATIFNEGGQYTKALDHLTIIEESLLASDLNNEKSNFFRLKATALEGIGQYKVANSYWKMYIDITEQKIVSENQKLLKEMETKYLTTEKDFEIQSLNSEKELSAVKLAASNQRNIGLGIGLIIFGFLSFLLFRLYGQLKKKNTLLTKALNDNKILLKEIHHRVKNNLQVVSSLLGLQSRFVNSDAALDAIKTGRARVQSMSLLHQNLYRNENLKSVNIKKYFEDLGQNLFSNYRLNDKAISFETDIDEMEMDIDIVVSMGLITNELISNSLKHAFAHQEEGKIVLKIKKMNGGVFLEVKDNGKGIPFTQIPERSDSLGTQLIKSFSHKLGAKISIENINGTSISILFDPYKIVAAA